MSAPRMGTVALAVRREQDQLILLDHFSDEREIAAVEEALRSGDSNPLDAAYLVRERRSIEDEEFGNYVEDLLSRPCVRPEVQDHGVQWLKSKIKIERFQKSEREASTVIADYAFRLYQEDPAKVDFILAGPAAQVRVRIFEIPKAAERDRSQVA